jgi:hypothetical protein
MPIQEKSFKFRQQYGQIVNELIESKKKKTMILPFIIAGCLAGIFLIVFYLLVGKILSQEKTIFELTTALKVLKKKQKI